MHRAPSIPEQGPNHAIHTVPPITRFPMGDIIEQSGNALAFALEAEADDDDDDVGSLQ